MKFYLAGRFRIKANQVLYLAGEKGPQWLVYFERRDGVIAQAEYDTFCRDCWHYGYLFRNAPFGTHPAAFLLFSLV